MNRQFDWQDVAKKLQKFVEDKAKAKSSRPNAGQRDALAALAVRLPEHGVLVADEVGLGKTLIAAEVIHAVVQCGGRVAVVMPAGLGEQWQDELRSVHCEAPTLLRSLQGLRARAMAVTPDGTSLNEAGVTLISHTFINWRIGGNTELWRYDLLPLMYKKWRKKKTGRLPRGSKQWHDVPELESFADYCITLYENNNKYYKILSEILENQVWDPVTLYSGDTYKKETIYRKGLEICVGMILGTFDFIVIDEAHKNRGEESGLSRCLNNFLSRSENCRVLSLTATPVELECYQWKDMLLRLNADEDIAEKVAQASEKYVYAVRQLQNCWQDESLLHNFETAASEFHEKLAPWVLRRTKAEDADVALFQKMTQGNICDRYLTSTEVPIEVSALDASWQQAVCAAEALSVTASLQCDRGVQRLRLTLGNGHGLAGILEGLPPEEDGSATGGDDSIAKNVLLKKRMARVEWWKNVIQRGVSDTSLQNGAGDDFKLYDYPTILAAVQYIEKITNTGEKVLVFGTYTRPLKELTELLNARALVRSWQSAKGASLKRSIPLEMVPKDLSKAVQAAMKQLKINDPLESLTFWVKTQYDADETRRKTFRQELHGNIEKGLKARKYSECLPGRVKKLCETWPIDNDEIVINFARAFGEVLSDDEISSPDSEKLAYIFIEFIDNICTKDEGDNDHNGILDENEARGLWKIIEERLNEEFSSARSHFARLIFGGTKHASRRTAQLAFNRVESQLKVLVAQSQVGREGLNLHKACRHVLLIHPEWNPGIVEQQVGRVDRVGSYWATLLHRYAKKQNDNIPHIELHCLIFKGTYDEYNWEVLKKRRLELRSQLHGEILPQTEYANIDEETIERVRNATPSFLPDKLL